MRRNLGILAPILFACALTGFAWSQTPAPKWPPHPLEDIEMEALIRAVAASCAEGDFGMVFALVEGAKQRHPDLPQPLVIEVFAQALFLNTYRGSATRDAYVNACARSEASLAQLLKKFPDDPRLHFYLGGVLGYRGMLEVLEGRFVRALGTGIDAVKHLEISSRATPPISDAQFGLALFYHTRFAYAKVFSWLPSYGDDQSKAYAALEEVRQRGVLLRDEAETRLISFRMQDGKWEGLEEDLMNLVRRHPRNLFLKTLGMEYALRRNRTELIGPLVKEAMPLVQAQPRTGRSMMFILRVTSAWAEFKQGKTEEAKTQAEALEDEIPGLEPWTNNQFWIKKLRQLLAEVDGLKKKKAPSPGK